jgi:hypothetical protein
MVSFLSRRVKIKIYPALVLRLFLFLMTFANLRRLICPLSFSVFAPFGWLFFITLILYFWWECHFWCTFTLSATQLGRNYSFAVSLVWVWNLVCKVMINYIMGRFMICAFRQIFLGWSHQGRRVSRAFATYGEGEGCIQGFGCWGTWRKHYLEDLGVDGRIILKGILKK